MDIYSLRQSIGHIYTSNKLILLRFRKFRSEDNRVAAAAILALYSRRWASKSGWWWTSTRVCVCVCVFSLLFPRSFSRMGAQSIIDRRYPINGISAQKSAAGIVYILDGGLSFISWHFQLEWAIDSSSIARSANADERCREAQRDIIARK